MCACACEREACACERERALGWVLDGLELLGGGMLCVLMCIVCEETCL